MTLSTPKLIAFPSMVWYRDNNDVNGPFARLRLARGGGE